jgi:ribonucleoside-diphosphate reductase alpha chain
MVFMEQVMRDLRDTTYDASADLAKEKGPFPFWEWEAYSSGKFIQTLPEDVKHKIMTTGIRNSHLTSIAPTGTISLTADNVSSGIEPPFALFYDRTIEGFDGQSVERVEDYAYSLGVKGRTANEITAEEHVKVLSVASQYVDSAVSKTCNVGDDVTYDEFKDLYYNAWLNGCKGITTFRAAGMRKGILNEANDNEPKAEACFIDPETGQKECE